MTGDLIDKIFKHVSAAGGNTGRQRSLEQQDVLIAGSSVVSRRVIMELWKLGAGKLELDVLVEV